MDTIGNLLPGFETPLYRPNSNENNSSPSLTSDSPPLSSLLGATESLTRPTWLFTSQSVYANQLSPNDAALSSLFEPFSPTLDNSLSVGQLTGTPFKQMTNRMQTPRRSFNIMSPSSESANPLGAPGTPITNGMATMQPAPPNAKNPKLYKTELCRTWMEHGRCNYGERCQYAHGEHEKRAIPRHPKYKTEACQSFHQNGYCPYGTRCHFIHNETEFLSQLSSPPVMSMFPSNNMRQTSGPGGPAMTPGAAAVQNPLLQRMSSLPSYGSAGESSSSGSSADSGSESPNGSFSPGLDLEDAGPFTVGFMTPQPLARRQLSQQYQRMQSAEPKPTEPIVGLLSDLLAFKFEDKWDDSQGRLPVFAQLSSGGR